MKKLTSNQQQYRKEIRRIRSSLSKLRKEGYDVSELARKYSLDRPKRITTKLLEELHHITPKKLRKELTSKFVGVTPKRGTRLTTPSTQWEQVQESTLRRGTQDKYTGLEQGTPFTEAMEAPSFIPSDEPFMEAPIVEEEPKPTTTAFTEALKRAKKELDKNAYKIENPDSSTTYVDKDTGEIIYETEPTETPQETIEEVPYEEQYVEEPYEYTPLDYDQEDIPDLSEAVIEYLRDFANQFNPSLRKAYQDAIDKMIREKGAKAVAEAFTETVDGHPDLITRVSSPQSNYIAMQELIGDMVEKLDVDINVKDLMRNEVTRYSMSDMEDYL